MSKTIQAIEANPRRDSQRAREPRGPARRAPHGRPQRAQAAYRQKAERAGERAQECTREYLKLTEERNGAITARARSLRKEVYAVESADALERR